MYWDVVEVRPEPDYHLFVRFKDGLAGNVRLNREQLTGVLAPLVNPQFFGQVFIDDGAVAWPGKSTWRPTLCTPRSRAGIIRVSELSRQHQRA